MTLLKAERALTLWLDAAFGGERQCSHRSERKLSTLQEQRQLICSWYFWPGKSKSRCVLDHAKFFKALGQRVKDLRKRRGYSQEDMIAFGFSARHWQQIEAGRPITLTTLLRIYDKVCITTRKKLLCGY